MKLDKHSSIPLYAQLRDLIVERINSGDYAPGSKIPSENDFCRDLDLSRPTVRQAISELVADGVLDIQKGRGTFVAEEPERLLLPHFNALSYSFLNMTNYENLGLRPLKLLEADPELDRLFRIGQGITHPGYWLAEWPLLFEGQTLGRVQSYIPVQFFPDLGQSLASGKRMVDIKSNKYAYLPQKGSLTLSVRTAKNKEAAALEIPRRSFILSLEGQLLARSGHVCEVLRILLRPDLCALEIN